MKKRIQCAIELMRAEHVDNVLFSKNFPYRELVLREGFDEIDESSLMGALAGKIALKFSGKEKAAAFFAERLTGSAERAFYDICRDFRYVMAAIETDCRRLFDSLGKKLGISVITHPTEKQLVKADVAIFYSPPRGITVLPEKCVAIAACADALRGVSCSKVVSGLTVGVGNGKEIDIPEGFAIEPLIAYAIYAGTIRSDDIILHDIKIADKFT